VHLEMVREALHSGVLDGAQVYLRSVIQNLPSLASKQIGRARAKPEEGDSRRYHRGILNAKRNSQHVFQRLTNYV